MQYKGWGPFLRPTLSERLHFLPLCPLFKINFSCKLLKPKFLLFTLLLQLETSWYRVHEAVAQQSEHCPGHSKSRCLDQKGGLEAKEKSKSVMYHVYCEYWNIVGFSYVVQNVICAVVGDGRDREQWDQDISTSRLWQWWRWRLQGTGISRDMSALHSGSAAQYNCMN